MVPIRAPSWQRWGMGEWEIVGTVLGIIGVALMVRQNIWGWPVGLVQVSVYGWVFYQSKLYSDAILQVFFFAIQAYGWVHWLRRGQERSALLVTRSSAAQIIGWILAGAAATGAWGTLMLRQTDAAMPYWDAAILMFSLIAQWLQARKKIECWPGWLVVNTIAIGVYWVRDLRLTAGLYFIFWLMAIWGWNAWHNARTAPVRQT